MTEKSGRVYDIVCGRCSAHDYVPFRPRPGSEVLCKTCFEKQRQESGGEPRQRSERSGPPNGRPNANRGPGGPPRRDDRTSGPPRRDDRGGPPRRDDRGGRPGGPPQRGPVHHKPRTWSIVCAACNKQDEVPFEPRQGSKALCKSCHEERKERKPARPANPVAPSIPRLEHGTRVYYPINCQKCGKSEVLTYVPKVNGELLCTECASERYGRTWYQVKLDAEDEQREHSIECATCARVDVLPFKPQAGRKYHCRRCLDEQVQPNKSRLEGFEDVDGGVRVRRG